MPHLKSLNWWVAYIWKEVQSSAAGDTKDEVMVKFVFGQPLMYDDNIFTGKDESMKSPP